MALPAENVIRQFIVDNFLFGQDEGHLSTRDSLLEKGLIDSTGILELVGFLQSHFGLKIEDEEIVPSNLDSIEKITRFLETKRGDIVAQR
ncbi:MAG TPA: acyl carrier protein [Candidatus Solibacter sp.]|nr:acyl carrier protein [Candidatus Solibacter sp.]